MAPRSLNGGDRSERGLEALYGDAAWHRVVSGAELGDLQISVQSAVYEAVWSRLGTNRGECDTV
jgi:hypothetical protein